MNECVREFINQATLNQLQLVNATDYIENDPPAPDQILADVIDSGDKLVIIGPSKMRKSFFALQLAMAVAAHPNFLGWVIPKNRRVLYVQLEIREHHCWRRVRNMARALGVDPHDIEDRLMIISGRGQDIRGAEGLERVRQAAANFQPEVIVIDPLYKISEGVENSAEDFKVLLSAFDKLAEETGAAIIFIHHDSKGAAGDKDIRDRGAGSNVLGRDYDAAITLTPHNVETDAAVVDTLLRNYKPQAPFTIVWEQQQDTGGYCFSLADDLKADKRTSQTKTPQTAIKSYLPVAEAILIGQKEMEIAYFKTLLKEKTALSDSRIRDFINWATLGDFPAIQTREQRGRGVNKKWVSMSAEGASHV